MRIIHTADIHLGAAPDRGKPWSEASSRTIWQTFYRLLDLCEQEAIDFLLIAGDLFHRAPLIRELKEVNTAFAALSCTRVVIIAGNHDYISPVSFYRTFNWNGNVTFIDSKSPVEAAFPDYNLYIQGFSYYHYEIKQPLLETLKPLKHHQDSRQILLAHGGDEAHVPISQQFLNSHGFDYLALGHIHKPYLNAEKRYGYAGCPEPADSGDTGVHGFILIEFDNGREAFTFHPFARNEYKEVALTIDPSANLTQVIRKLSDMNKTDNNRCIYRLTLKGLRDPDILFSREMISDVIKLSYFSDETIPDYDLEAILKEHSKDIIGSYIRSFDIADPIQKKALYYGLGALMSQTF